MARWSLPPKGSNDVGVGILGMQRTSRCKSEVFRSIAGRRMAITSQKGKTTPIDGGS
jgi:hypothetical protein